jgi:IS30 family transposase
MSTSYRHITAEERSVIMSMKLQQASMRAIGQALGRAPSTISRELRRNGYKPDSELGPIGRPRIAGGYDACRAHARYRRMRRQARPLPKLHPGSALWAQVRMLLGQRWSPTQIAATLKREHPERRALQVSHETIYTAIYAAPRGALRKELVALLRQGRGARRPRSRGTDRRGSLQDILSIHVRPPEIEDRIMPGHWEGDFIKGARNRSSVGVLVERSTRLVVLAKMQDATAASALLGFTAKLNAIAAPMRRSLTYDQGKEMAQHAKLSEATGVRVYFCDPHSPWQRGTCENTNGLLRQYLPRGADLSVYTQEDLDAIADSMNTRPRKTLDWRTPLQAFALALSLAELATETTAH